MSNSAGEIIYVELILRAKDAEEAVSIYKAYFASGTVHSVKYVNGVWVLKGLP